MSGTLEIRSWILGWGADVEVLEPAPLRAEIAGIVHAAADRVRGTDDGWRSVRYTTYPMQSAPARGRRGLAVVAAVLALTAISVSLPAPTHASTESTMETSLKLWINRDRLARGLHRLRNDTRLEVLAGDRASWMASKGSLTHTSADGAAMRRDDEAVDLLVSLRRGHRLHDGDLGQGLGQVHLQPVASQPRPLGPADVVEVQLPRHRRRPPVEWRDVRLDRLPGGSRPDRPDGQDAFEDGHMVGISSGPGRARTSGSRPTPPGSRATTSSCASTTARTSRSGRTPRRRR